MKKFLISFILISAVCFAGQDGKQIVNVDPLILSGKSEPAVSASGKGKIYFDSGSNIFKVSENGGAYGPLVISGAGSGDVVGPASGTDECFARFDSTTGKLLQDSAVCANDSGNFTSAINSVRTNSAGGSANPFDITSTLGIFDGSDDYTAIDINLTNADHTGATNTVQGLDISGITADAQATETAINIGNGWDVGINAGNNSIVTTGNVGIGATSPLGPLYISANSSSSRLVEVVPATAAANDVFFKASAPGAGITGTVHPFSSDVDTSSQARWGNVQRGAGDPVSYYAIFGTTEWTQGIDNSDSDKFKLSASSGLGTSDVLSFTTAGVADFATALADSEVADTLTVSGGTVDNSVIGGTTPAAGSFTTLSASTSAIIALKTPGVPVNLNIVSATTTNAGDSIKWECGGAACSASNPGYIAMPSVTTAGRYTLFTITSDVTLLLTGAHWGIGTTGDITGAILRAALVNDNGTLRYCAMYQGGRVTLTTTDTNATPTNINLPEEVLCDTAVGSASNTVVGMGWVRGDFDDTGGVSEDLWAIQTGVDDVVTADTSKLTLCQPWNPVWTGFSANPTNVVATFCQNGSLVTVTLTATAGTSNSTSLDFTLPFKAVRAARMGGFLQTNNGSAGTSPARIDLAAGSQTATTAVGHTGATWTNVNAKLIQGSFTYEVN